MPNLEEVDIAVGILCIAVCLLYSAWHDYKSGNMRDSKLMAAVGAVSLIGATISYVH